MNINIEIRSIKQWYRNSTKEWIIDVNFVADIVGGNIRYSNKKLNNSCAFFKIMCNKRYNSIFLHF